MTNKPERGLSPLTRGTQAHGGTDNLANRFIPAGAGNTAISGRVQKRWPVYPRWRGEHHKRAVNMKKYPGLSPLARGTRSHRQSQHRVIRFIPAGAGNTPAEVCTCECLAVYPRWRGEHSRSSTEPKPDVGLSPLARGTLIKVV